METLACVLTLFWSSWTTATSSVAFSNSCLVLPQLLQTLSRKHPLLQTMNYLTSFPHPSKQIFPVVLILFFLIFSVFLSILHSIVLAFPNWLHSCKVKSYPLKPISMVSFQAISLPYKSLFYIHPLGIFFSPKESLVWVFLSQTGTCSHSFLHCLCDRLTLHLHGELNTVISTLMQLICYMQILLHSKFSHAEILSLFWHFAENTHVFSPYNIGHLFLVKAK